MNLYNIQPHQILVDESADMNLETAASLGEMLGGLAILFTLIFGFRQVKQWAESKKIDAARSFADHVSTPMIQYAFVIVINNLTDDVTFQQYDEMARKDKDAVNALMFGLNTNGILAYKGYLSLEIVAMFYQPVILGAGIRLRKIMQLLTENAHEKGGLVDPLIWAKWLLDEIEKLPPIKPLLAP